MGEELVDVQIKLPKRVLDFLREEAKKWNKTVQEYIDFVIQVDIAGVLIELTYDGKQTAGELAFDLGLHEYITEGKKQWVGAKEFDDLPRPRPRQATDR